MLSIGLLLAAASGNALGAFFVASTVSSDVAPGTAGLLAAMSSLGGVATRIAIGWLADRTHARWLLVVALQLATGSIGYVLLATGRPVLMALGGLLGYCSGWAWARMHHGRAARATGYSQAGLGLGSAIGPLAFGATVATASYQTAWLGTAGVSLLAAAVVVLGRQLLLRERPALAEAHRGRRSAQRRGGASPR